MSDRCLILRENRLSGNHIPSGRQLHRTPPLATVKKHLDFCHEDSNKDHEEPQKNMEVVTTDQDDSYQNTTFDFNTTGTNSENISEPDDPISMLKGMKGYQVTPSDLEFIKKMKEEKLLKKLQGDLEEVQRLLKHEMMSFELLCACRENAQADLKMLPSCEDMNEWAMVVLEMTSPSTKLADQDTESLLAMVTPENIQRATDEKRIELARLEKMVANKRRKEAQERGELEKQIASEQLKIQRLMSQLSDLKSELAQQEEAFKALEMQINTQEAPENKAEEVDTAEELQAAKTQEISRGKGRTKAVKFTEKLQDTTNQSKSTRGRHTDSKTDNQISVKDDHANKNTGETLKTKQKSGTAGERLPKMFKKARGPKKKVEESNSQVQDVRGRRKPPEAARIAASQPKNQTHVKTGKAQSSSQPAAPSQGRKKSAVASGDAGEEPQNTGLRRSKRIASRK